MKYFVFVLLLSSCAVKPENFSVSVDIENQELTGKHNKYSVIGIWAKYFSGF